MPIPKNCRGAAAYHPADTAVDHIGVGHTAADRIAVDHIAVGRTAVGRIAVGRTAGSADTGDFEGIGGNSY